MDQMLTAMTAAAALLLSLGLATLAEELVFGGIFRYFFAAHTPQHRDAPRGQS